MALKNQRLEDLVLDLSGCERVSRDVRAELKESIRSQTRFRRMNTWVHIEAPVDKGLQCLKPSTRRGASLLYYNCS